MRIKGAGSTEHAALTLCSLVRISPHFSQLVGIIWSGFLCVGANCSLMEIRTVQDQICCFKTWKWQYQLGLRQPNQNLGSADIHTHEPLSSIKGSIFLRIDILLSKKGLIN